MPDLDSDSFLDSGLSLGNALAFLMPEGYLVAQIGILSGLQIVQLFKAGHSAVADAIGNSTQAIIGHIHDLSRVVEELIKQEKRDEMLNHLKTASSWIAEIDATLYPKHLEPMERINESLYRGWDAQSLTVTGENSNLRDVMQFSRDHVGPNYVLLNLGVTAALVYLNACKFIAELEFRYLCQQYAAIPAGTPKPERPNRRTGERLSFLNTTIHKNLKDTLDFAVPIVRNLNEAVIARQKAADDAAASVKVVKADGELFTLNPSVAVTGPAGVNVGNLLAGGYGQLSQRGAENLCRLRRGQLRSEAWHRATLQGRLTIFSLKSLQALNHTLWRMNEAMGQYAPLVGEPPPPSALAGIYPPPNPNPLAALVPDAG